MSLFDVLLVDIQDVGLRYYTYYITMYRLMDVCAKYDKKVIVLDRPNPNGFYVDGPVLDMNYKSGVGYLPIPVSPSPSSAAMWTRLLLWHWTEAVRTNNSLSSLSILLCR